MRSDSPDIGVRLSGSGGQGVMLAGLLLAEAGMLDGLHVVQTQSYGPEARLGAAKSDVVLSNEEIAFPEVLAPDLLLCLSADAYRKYGQRLADGGMRVLDERVGREVDVGDDLVLPMTRTARELGNVIVGNVVALGALVGMGDLVSRDALSRALEGRSKPAMIELNGRALDAGLELGAHARESLRV
jgi:2-oxoglutarate ferredoxin oxidoreductase subunit gamma